MKVGALHVVAKPRPWPVWPLLFFGSSVFLFLGCAVGESVVNERLCASVTCGGRGVCVAEGEHAICACNSGATLDPRNVLNCLAIGDDEPVANAQAPDGGYPGSSNYADMTAAELSTEGGGGGILSGSDQSDITSQQQPIAGRTTVIAGGLMAGAMYEHSGGIAGGHTHDEDNSEVARGEVLESMSGHDSDSMNASAQDTNLGHAVAGNPNPTATDGDPLGNGQIHNASGNDQLSNAGHDQNSPEPRLNEETDETDETD